MLVTAASLRKLGACSDQVAEFERLFGAEVVVTEALCREHARRFDWDWAAENLFPAAARRAYDEAKAPAWRAYGQATAPARRAYREATAPAWRAYDEATAPARRAYDEAKAPAFGRIAETLVTQNQGDKDMTSPEAQAIIDDGGRAFATPFVPPGEFHGACPTGGRTSAVWAGSQGQQGMPLLAWFAGKALPCVHADGGRYGPEGAAQVAKYAFDIAEAMIAEMRKRKGGG